MKTQFYCFGTLSFFLKIFSFTKKKVDYEEKNEDHRRCTRESTNIIEEKNEWLTLSLKDSR